MKISDETVSCVTKILVTVFIASILYTAVSKALISPIKEVGEKIKNVEDSNMVHQECDNSTVGDLSIRKIDIDGHSYIYAEKKFSPKDWGGYNYQYSISLAHDENCKCKTNK